MTEGRLLEDDYRLLKELIGSAMYFSDVHEYGAIVEEKVKSSTSWDEVRIVPFDKDKGQFVVKRRWGREDVLLQSFYSFDSSIIQKIKDRTGIYKVELTENSSGYESNVYRQGYKMLALSPILLREEFAGVLVGYSKESDVKKRDEAILEISAEIIALSINTFHLSRRLDRLLLKIEEYERELVYLESSKILGNIAGSSSHKINNLLSGILGYAQIIESKTTDEDIKQEIQTIKDAAIAGRKLIKDLLELKKVDLDLEMDLVNINEIMERAVNLTRAKWQWEAQARNVEYRVEMDLKDPVFILGNSSTLLEAFVIFILKSIETIPRGGKLIIEASSKDDCSIVSFETFAMAGNFLVDLDPFIHSKKDSQREVNIEVAKEIVKRHQGNVIVEEKIGQGLRIVVEIPVINRQIKDITLQREFLKRSGVSILVVEDEPIVRSLLKDVLTAEGFKVTTAEDGEKALKVWQDKEFDLIITDLGMPVMSGFELAAKVRAKSDIPIILTTGWESQIDRKKVKKYKINRIVGKPFQLKELIDAIYEIL